MGGWVGGWMRATSLYAFIILSPPPTHPPNPSFYLFFLLLTDPNEDLDSKIKRVTQLPLVSQPGSKWQYGLSTDVLLLIAAKVTGMKEDEFLSKRLLGRRVGG